MIKQTYGAKCRKLEHATTNRFYELVLALDPNYAQSLGMVRTTLSDLTIYKLKKQAAAEAHQ